MSRSRRRTVLRGTAVGIGAAAVLLAPVVSVDAATPTATGWWTSASAGPLSAVLLPDAPEGGMLVQGGSTPEEPFAYGALRYSIAADEEPTTLVLTTAPGSVTTGTDLIVCPLVEDFEPTAGAPTQEGPGWDCATSAESVADAEGVFRFDVGSFPTSDSLAVAVLPAGSTDRVALDAPDTKSLTTVRAAPPPASPMTGPGPAAGPASPPPADGPADVRTGSGPVLHATPDLSISVTTTTAPAAPTARPESTPAFSESALPNLSDLPERPDVRNTVIILVIGAAGAAASRAVLRRSTGTTGWTASDVPAG